MSVPARSAPRRPRRAAIPALVGFCFFITLFPPLQWIVGDGGVWFFIVTGALVLVSLWAMYLIDARLDPETIDGPGTHSDSDPDEEAGR
ncbi:hypothetical protein D3248_08080 [Leucobacter zeae]|nr:hypothetical protein [Leucobacter zeae]